MEKSQRRLFSENKILVSAEGDLILSSCAHFVERERRWEREDSGERTVARESYRERELDFSQRTLGREEREDSVHCRERKSKNLLGNFVERD
jgi:hypothetical protein